MKAKSATEGSLLYSEAREAAQMCGARPDLGRGFNEISAEVGPSPTAPSLRGYLLVLHPFPLLCVSAAGV